MNNEIKPGDMVALDAQGQVILATDTAEAFAVWEDIGMIVRYAGGISRIKIDEKFCCLCHVSYYEHGVNDPHPFFNNNLELLEWLDEQKNGSPKII